MRLINVDGNRLYLTLSERQAFLEIVRLDIEFLVQVLEAAIQDYGYPLVMNADQGVQFVNEAFHQY